MGDDSNGSGAERERVIASFEALPGLVPAGSLLAHRGRASNPKQSIGGHANGVPRRNLDDPVHASGENDRNEQRGEEIAGVVGHRGLVVGLKESSVGHAGGQEMEKVERVRDRSDVDHEPARKKSVRDAVR